MKLKLNLKKLKTKVAVILLIATSHTFLAAQTSDTTGQDLVKSRIESMIKKVDSITENYYPTDSLILENTKLKQQLRLKDSILRALEICMVRKCNDTCKHAQTDSIMNQTKENTKGSINQYEKTAMIDSTNTYIVLSAYKSLKAAEEYRTIHNWSGYDIIPSQSGKRFYIVRQIASNENFKDVKQKVKVKTGVETVWVYKTDHNFDKKPSNKTKI